MVLFATTAIYRFVLDGKKELSDRSEKVLIEPRINWFAKRLMQTKWKTTAYTDRTIIDSLSRDVGHQM